MGTIDRVPHPHTLEWLRSTFVPVDMGRRRRLWLCRPSATARHVVNEEAALDALRPLGFEPVTLDGLSIAAQARLFAAADVVAGPHGAAFANLVFAAAGTRVVELVPGDYRPAFFPALAQAGGQAYIFLPCAPRPSPQQVSRSHPRDWNMVVDIPTLVRAVQQGE
ncbi:MAG: glycosyltransferase family 61 protein [Magnetospirillum sp.]|nr:glycosyltransferase family 61 protein [Magnetospirillum sp.]